MLRDDLGITERSIHRLVTVDLNQNQFDALVAFTFNLGAGNLQTSTLLKLLNRRVCSGRRSVSALEQSGRQSAGRADPAA